MKTESFSLPRALFSANDIQGYNSHLKAIETKMSALAMQRAALRLAEIFNDYPQLTAFYILRESVYNDEGYDEMTAAISNRGDNLYDDDGGVDNELLDAGVAPGDPRDLGLHEKLCRWGGSLNDAERGRFERKVMRRPAGALVDGVMEQTLSPSDYAAWQAAWLDQSAKAAVERPRSEPRL